ncbi:hypothetical protein [Roseibium sediminicola]|uniref:Uncharacterized protein n=1 Tax=Roseibium sediminicola TaxID=2933272 RepID=A0ABT0GP69_9HYPH|nr:hypothetical protein [Roseibium sp. CAU 1639]MCK7611213.1 hypothetical protein [Roseibium sp. CAU 1639]
MSLQTIIQNRQRALFNAWIQDPLMQVQVEHPGQLGRLAFADRRDGTFQARQLAGSSLENVAFIERPGNPDQNASVWVRAGYSGYQKAWLNFIEQVYDLKATATDLAGYNIDHLYNRARSPGLAGFVRIEAINGAVNQAWGRNFERAVSRNATGSNKRERNTMSWTIAAKLMGQPPPRGPNDHQGIARLVQFFARNGLSAADAKRGVENMLTHAYWAR